MYLHVWFEREEKKTGIFYSINKPSHRLGFPLRSVKQKFANFFQTCMKKRNVQHLFDSQYSTSPWEVTF